MQTERVNVPLPADRSKVWDVELNPGTAGVTVAPTNDGLVVGVIEYNVREIKPVITTGNYHVKVEQGKVDGVLPLDTHNDWRLSLGLGVPMRLTVNAGATRGQWNLGGLSLRAIDWRQGASETTIRFPQPNRESLESFYLEGGASALTVEGLANANVKSGRIRAGAGNLDLYFDGRLAQNADIAIEGGVSLISIYSGGNPVQAIMEGGISSTSRGDWTQSGDTYYSPEWAKATGPRITLRLKLGVGSLRLVTGK